MTGVERVNSTVLDRLVTPQRAGKIFVGLIMLVCAFQLALALGAPWGRFAMGGIYPHAYPPAMRLAALVQIAVLAGAAPVILSRAGLAWRTGCQQARWLTWAITAMLLLGVALNLISPSQGERLLWTPVALGLFLSAARVAFSRPSPHFRPVNKG